MRMGLNCKGLHSSSETPTQSRSVVVLITAPKAFVGALRSLSLSVHIGWCPRHRRFCRSPSMKTTRRLYMLLTAALVWALAVTATQAGAQTEPRGGQPALGSKPSVPDLDAQVAYPGGASSVRQRTKVPRDWMDNACCNCAFSDTKHASASSHTNTCPEAGYHRGGAAP